MKVIRVPWIQCRADEAGAECFPMEWRGKDFEIMAYNEREAQDWWRSLGDSHRSEVLGMRDREESDGTLMMF